MGLADNANDDGALLDSFLGIFDLEDTALRRAEEGRGQRWLMDGGLGWHIQGDRVVVVVIAEHGCGVM